MPDDEKNDNEGNRDAGMEATTVGIGLLKVLGKLTTIGFYVRCVLGCLATLDLLLALGLGHKAVEFILPFGSINMYALEAARLTGFKECHLYGMYN